MGYEIQISEVGPAEYPLMEVLRETIFGECGHHHLSSLADDLEGRTDIHAVMAHLEGNPVGFKIGYRDRPGVYYSKAGGVLKEYRRLGLANRMQEWQHSFARARGYRTVYFNSFNRFKVMIRFGLRSGFLPFGVQRREDLLAVQFALDLNAPGKSVVTESPLIAANAPGHEAAERVSGRRAVRHDDVAGLLAAVDEGFDFTGMRRTPTGVTYMLMELEERG